MVSSRIEDDLLLGDGLLVADVPASSLLNDIRLIFEGWGL